MRITFMLQIGLALISVAQGVRAAPAACTGTPTTPKPPVEEMVRTGGSVATVDAAVTLNDLGAVAFSGTDAAGLSQLFVVTAPGTAPLAVSGNGSASVNYSGAALHRTANTLVATRQRNSGAPPTYFIRQWAIPGPVTSLLAGSSGAADFDSGQNTLSMNGSGVVAFYGLVGGSTSTRLFEGTSRPPITIATFNSVLPIRPQIGDSGAILIRDNIGQAMLFPASGVGPPELVAGASAPFGGFSGILIRPGVAADGNAVGFIANRGAGLGVFAWIRTSAGPVYQSLAGDGAADGFTAFPDEQRVGVTSTDLDTGVRRVDVAFMGTRTVNAQTSSGVFVARVTVAAGAVVQVTPPCLILANGAQSAGPLQGATVSSISLSEPMNCATQVGALANLSAGQSVVRLNPCGRRPTSMQPVFPKHKQFVGAWANTCLVGSYGQATDPTCSCRLWSGAADAVGLAKCMPTACSPGSFTNYGCTITSFSTVIARCMTAIGASSGFPDLLVVQQQLFQNRMQSPCRGTVDAGSLLYKQNVGGGTLTVNTSRSTTNDFRSILQDLKGGLPVILSVPRMSSKPANTAASVVADGGGVHFIVAYDYEPTGGIGEASNILINDPGDGCTAYGQAGMAGNVLGFDPVGRF